MDAQKTIAQASYNECPLCAASIPVYPCHVPAREQLAEKSPTPCSRDAPDASESLASASH